MSQSPIAKDTAASQSSQVDARSSRSRASVTSGRVLSGLAILFLTFDAAMKLLLHPQAVVGTTELGYAADLIRPLGVIQIACLVLHVVPRTAIMGAVLMTGYLGGAIATHVRLGNPLFSHVLFPIYVAILLWGGLFLRDARMSAMLAKSSR